MLAYWANIFGMLGVGVIVSALFQKESFIQHYGAGIGSWLILLGAFIIGLKKGDDK